ncbi:MULTISPECIES: hypothetical protein [unclassified Maridesulfovibrio]|uniref:hypothetical protein n=1 Tax=unclassified Maridesulfovibrio TaxID=2794999 RepID=UPI003B3D5534
MLSYNFIYFDHNDHLLVELFNNILSRKTDQARFRSLLSPYLKPHGIKELAAPYGIRIAYAVFNLLSSLESDEVNERLHALSALKNEVMATSKTTLRNNRARVLIQIAKEIIRSGNDEQKQLRLAHDFRSVSFGKSSFIREQLKKYHLLEMPEEWNQLTFDDRVHDANSKGRKSASHLVMDAWIKGIRRLRVVYYDFLSPEVAIELYSAAQLLDIKVEFGIELRAVVRNRYVKFVWTPKNIIDQKDIAEFFENAKVQEIMQFGKTSQIIHAEYIRRVTAKFNSVHRQSIEREVGVKIPEIDYTEFQNSLKSIAPTLTHLGKYIHEISLPHFKQRVNELAAVYLLASIEEKSRIDKQVDSINLLDPDTITVRYLSPQANSELPNPNRPPASKEAPAPLIFSPDRLTEKLLIASPSSRVTLILENMELEDAVEFVYDCKGRITHFELINLKNITEKNFPNRVPFNRLQQALNTGNSIGLKKIVRSCVDKLKRRKEPQQNEQLAKLIHIQQHIEELKNSYKHRKIRTRIGSGSTGGSLRAIGMGFAVADTLPPRARKEIKENPDRKCLPVSANLSLVIKYMSQRNIPLISSNFMSHVKDAFLLREILQRKEKKWEISNYQIEHGQCGNISPLGGLSQNTGNGLSLIRQKPDAENKTEPQYINSTLKNIFKIIIGFIPAFLTFYLTKDWWVLAWLGGLIWFSITGFRNIIQSILGGGGLKRSPYLVWSDFINWNRIADSLLFTGFSVPLLDWLCKSVVLDGMFNINIANNPTMLYTIMAITNGIYITGHNIMRELPKEAAFGNFFRSIISIPIAIVFSYTISAILYICGVPEIDMLIQQWAAVISKLASDFAAGFLEGMADRKENIIARSWDYEEKIRQVLNFFSEMEVRFPNKDLLSLLESPAEFIKLCRSRGVNDDSILMANALDLLYLRMYQPRAKEALQQAIRGMSKDEKEIFRSSQQILNEKKSVSHIIVDGLIGNNFSKPLSFYLRRHEGYLLELDRIIAPAKAS